MILVINAGSSSIKFALYDVQANLALLYSGQFSAIGSKSVFSLFNRDNVRIVNKAKEVSHHYEALLFVLSEITALTKDKKITAVGHRVVHGGHFYIEPVIVSDTVIANLESLIPLAELHQPHNIEAMKIIGQRWPELPQVACFDTAFHHTMPEVEQQIALDKSLLSDEIKRYGFHGLSYQYIANILPDYLGEIAAEGRIIVAHLGAGASLCAIKNRQSVATTMSFTPLDGLPMATRCGSLDPGVLLYLLEQKNITVEQLSKSMNHHSGLKALSGFSGDMQLLLASDTHDAQSAIDYFVYQTCRHIGAMVSTLNGLDALVFTGGIGEHAVEIRKLICQKLKWLGLELNEQKNQQGSAKINNHDSSVEIWVIETDEEQLIASETNRCVFYESEKKV